jgi:nucleoside-diphosphate-sugar epimerase
MKILITGGCGFKGSVLIPKLLKEGHEITNIDIEWFGNYLKPNKNLNSIKRDIRNIEDIAFDDFDAIIHLANIANDPAVELNPTMSWEVNVLASHQLIEKAKRANIKQFLFASSGSVYGVKKEEKVTENLSLVPISTYNKTKMIAERVLMSYESSMKIHIIRPATVCGVSPRMRLDVAVNLLTFQALTKNKITVLGGQQVRPNIHIDDVCDVYIHFINNPNISSGFYNAGFENVSILDIAKLIKSKINCDLEISPSNDPRSYRQDSTKLLKTGYKPKKNIDIAIDELISAYKKEELTDKDQWHTVGWMKSQGFN